MNIGFDAKRAYLNNTGLGNYARTLMLGMVNRLSENNYFLYTPIAEKVRFHMEMVFHENVKVLTPEGYGKLPFSKSLWRTFGIPSSFGKYKIDLYHGLSNEIPWLPFYTKTKSLVTIHDLIFLRHPEFYSGPDIGVYKRKVSYACKRADKIMAVSEQTRQDISEFYKKNIAEIEVVYQSCNPIFYRKHDAKEIDEVKTKLGLPKEYILFVGTIEPRKNISTLIKALSLCKSNISLVVIGQKKKHFDELLKLISREKIYDRVLFPDHVHTEVLPMIYQGANLFVYPSIFEGFGIPVIEALYSGIPVITSTGSCFKEAGGPGTIYVSPFDAEEMAHQIERVLEDTELRKKMIETGSEYVSRFHINQVVDRTWEVYKSMK